MLAVDLGCPPSDLNMLRHSIGEQTNSSSEMIISNRVIKALAECLSALKRNNVSVDVVNFFSSTSKKYQKYPDNYPITLSVPKEVKIFIKSIINDPTKFWISVSTVLPSVISIAAVATGVYVVYYHGDAVAEYLHYGWDRYISPVTDRLHYGWNRYLSPVTEDTTLSSDNSNNDSDAIGSTVPSTPANDQRETLKGRKKKTSLTTAETPETVYTDDGTTTCSTAPGTPANYRRKPIKERKKKTSPTTAETPETVYTGDSTTACSTAPSTPANYRRKPIKEPKKKTGPTTASNAASDGGSTPIDSKKRSCAMIVKPNDQKKKARQSRVVDSLGSKMVSMTTDSYTSSLNSSLTMASDYKNLAANDIPTINS